MELVLVPLALVIQFGISYIFIEKFGGRRDARAVVALAGRPSLSQSLVRSTEFALALPEDESGSLLAFPAASSGAGAASRYGVKAA
jgi:hypothetical protein